MVAEFAARLGVSGMTIRRDLLALEEQQLLNRVHGGAVRRQAPSKTRHRGPVLTIGIVVPSATYYFPAFIAGAKAVAAEENVRLILGVTHYQPEHEQNQIRRLLQIGVDGLIVTSGGQELDRDQTYRSLADANVPVIVMERPLAEVPSDLPLGGVRSDHVYGAELAVRHLVECGRARLGLVVERVFTTDQVRAGFRKAVTELLPGTTPPEFEVDIRLSGPEQRAEHASILEECLNAEVDGLLVLPDALAGSIADLAVDRGVDVPREMSIVAYDDEIASLAALPLTAVSPPKFDVGAVAVRMCVQGIRQRAGVGELPAGARVLLPPSVVVRDSSAVHRAG